MNNTVENDFFGFRQVRVATSDSEVNKSVKFSCHIFSEYQKSLKSVNF